LNPPPVINTLQELQPLMAPNQGLKIRTSYLPVVAITQPLPGSTIISGSTVTLAADANLRAGSSGSISSVAFHANGNLIGTATASPYAVQWPNVGPGKYHVQAEAVTSDGVKTRSESIQVQAINYAGLQSNYAAAIAVNFVSYAVTAMAPSEVAGLVPQANWNQALGTTNSGTLTNLLDQSGTATTAGVEWTSPNTYSNSIPDEPGDNRMMKGYLDNNNVQRNTVHVFGLPTSFRRFDVIVYFDGGAAASRAGNYRLTILEGDHVRGCASLNYEGSTITGLDPGGVNFSGAFIQTSNGTAGNYVKFVDCSGDNFSLAPIHAGSADSQYRAPVNGIQILARAD
jgi:Bacterial Ig domain